MGWAGLGHSRGWHAQKPGSEVGQVKFIGGYPSRLWYLMVGWRYRGGTDCINHYVGYV